MGEDLLVGFGSFRSLSFINCELRGGDFVRIWRMDRYGCASLLLVATQNLHFAVLFNFRLICC